MNLRQKLAWLLVMVYLGCSFVCFYYLLDLADQFSVLSVAHSKLHQVESRDDSWRFSLTGARALPLLGPNLVKVRDPHKIESFEKKSTIANNSIEHNFWHHIVDVPINLLVLLGMILYCQVFALLYFFTLPHIHSIKNFNVFLIPFLGWYYIVLRCKSLFGCQRQSGRIYIISRDEKGLSHG